MTRATRSLPSPLKHFAAALTVLALAGLGVWGLLQADPPAPRTGSLALPEREVPVPADSLLANEDGPLPDLLAGIVEPGANPTENYIEPAIPPGGNPAPTPKVISLEGAMKADPLPKAPLATLQAETDYGPVPSIGQDGLTPFEAYRRPPADVDGPVLAIVVGGLGINPDMTRRAIESLPPQITLGFAAHAPNLQTQIDLAREYGHEVVLELPMESGSQDPSAPYADRMLRVDAVDANGRNLDYLLSRAGGYFAVVPYGGDRFLSRADAAAPVLEKLAQAGLGFVSDPQLQLPTLTATAQAARVRYRKGTMLIDADPTPEAIRNDLEGLVARATAGERAIGFGFAYPSTIDALIAFEPDGTALVPLSSAFQ